MTQESDEDQTSTVFATGALALAQQLGDPWAVGVSFVLLGSIALAQASFDEAERLFASAIAKFDDRSDRD
jgi:hypothetical protein